MLDKLQQFFDQYLAETSTDNKSLQHQLQLASAALMVEMLHVDEEVNELEEIMIHQLLQQRFKLNADEIASLLDLAYDKKHEATDYYEFTSLLNQHYSQEQKIMLVEDLWQIAYADNVLDKFEEHLVRRLAELLHVPHHEFIRTKHSAS